ncbi:MAG: dTDP-4-dehydrorhamnose 3,5-epimerase [bacterium]
MPFNFKPLEIEEVVLIEPRSFSDDRGYFYESYKRSDFVAFGITDLFMQDNQSRSKKNVIRGLHYQTNPKAQAKLVRCVHGEIFDVAVDIRKNSPTYKKWVGAVLNEENKAMLYIPAGFAHGFSVLSNSAEVCYKASDEYSPENDAGILWSDPEIGVKWGITNPIISEKDAILPTIENAINNFIYDKE